MSVTSDVLGATARALSDAAASGQGMRVSCKGLAYGLSGYLSLASRLSHVTVDGLNYHGLRVKDSATPVKAVAEASAKPKAADTESTNVALGKFAGYAELSLEVLLSTDEAARVVTDVLYRQALQALDAAIITEAGKAGNSTAITSTATSVGGKLIDAAATVMAAGGRPGVVAVNPTDYAKIIGATDNSGYVNTNDPERGPSGLFMGMALVPTAAAAADTAYVIDPAAIVVAENTESPLLFLSPMSTSNVATVILDLVAAPLVVLPAGVGKVALK